MNEQEVYQTIIKEQIINDDTVRRYACAAPERKPALRVLKPIGIALAALVLIAGVTMTIPSARAEVLSWFMPHSPESYLGAGPEQRTPVAELDATITTPSPEQCACKVLYAAEDSCWQMLAESFSATVGETYYLGKNIYMTVDFDGISGYPNIENEIDWEGPAGSESPFLFGEKLAPGMIARFREDRFDVSPFLSGVMEAWVGPSCSIGLVLGEGENELCIYGDPYVIDRPEDLQALRALNLKYPKLCAERSRLELAYYRETGIRTVTTFHLEHGVDGPFMPPHDLRRLADFTDENGFLHAKVVYRAVIDHGDENELKFEAELGEIDIDMQAYQGLEQKVRPISAVSIPDTILSGRIRFGSLESSRSGYTFTNYETETDGIAISPISLGRADLLGIHNIRFLMVLPESWSYEQQEAFAHALRFDVLIDNAICPGVIYTHNSRQVDGTYIIALDELSGIPFDRLDKIRSVTLTPKLSYFTEIQVRAPLTESYDEPMVIDTIPMGPGDSFDSESLSEGADAIGCSETVVYPAWMITLRIDG